MGYLLGFCIHVLLLMYILVDSMLLLTAVFDNKKVLLNKKVPSLGTNNNEVV